MNLTEQQLAEQDKLARLRALEPHNSFIVQAPAGSGKTELLTQRILVLLAQVNQPEEVLALTFTRKAAGEMSERILERLQQALTEPRPESPHQQLSWDLARQVVLRDQALGWCLLESPQRLQLLTIDSLCAMLVRQMPWLSQFGGPVKVADRAGRLYQQAAAATIAALDGEDEPELVAALLFWLESKDQRLDALQQAIAQLLALREQWAAAVFEFTPEQQQDYWANELDLEQRLAPLLDWSPEFWARLLSMARFSAKNRAACPPALQALAALPLAMPDDWLEVLPALAGLTDLLLDSSNEWRKANSRSITARQGFPAKTPEQATFIEILTQLQQQDASEQGQLLALLQQLPTLPSGFGAMDAEALAHLQLILRRAYLELQLVFAERGEADFSEIAQRALTALGSEHQPTDLALRLDARFNHILVDEFQDTSQGQVRLLTLLTAGWQQGDGRTLFVVGDPMQSIYRFRQAAVGLFLQIQQQGLKPELPLIPLFLRRNFRSQAALVTWVNQSFSQILPQQANISQGAVTYNASLPSLPEQSPTVEFHLLLAGAVAEPNEAQASDNDFPADEPGRIVALVQEFRLRQPQASVAILVRARSHLKAILPALKAAGLAFQAVELEFLAGRQAIADVLSLAYALLYPHDRSHWLGLLRAPWCGLTLADLHQLVVSEPEQSLWSLIEARLTQLSADGQRRLAVFQQRLAPIWAARGRVPWPQLIESAWLILAGPASLNNQSELQDIQQLLLLLERCCYDGRLDQNQFEESLAELFASTDPDADAGLQLMTIHKSKGLEFDLVILPGLAAKGLRQDSALLYWHNNEYGQTLLAAELPGDAALGHYLRQQKQRADDLELARLLYVAATRAKQELQLLATIRPTTKGELKAPAGSLLALLWDLPLVQAECAQVSDYVSEANEPFVLQGALLRRFELATLAELPDEPEPIKAPTDTEALLPLHASLRAKELGIVFHRVLEQIARDGLEHWPVERRLELAQPLQRMLEAKDLPVAEAETAATEILSGLELLLASPEHRWLLERQQQEQVEYGLTLVDKQGLSRVFLDRTFVDADGTRWILDYKTGRHQGSDLDAYIQLQSERYREQLEHYARLMAKLESRPIKLALYFTAHGRLNCWDWLGEGAEAAANFGLVTNGD